MISHSLNVLAAVVLCTTSLLATKEQASRPWVAAHRADELKSARDTVSFSLHVMPILQRACHQCHGGVGENGEVVVEEGLDMTSYEKLMAGSLYGTVIEPGDPDGSYLIELIVAGDMPKEGDALTPAEIEIISQWVAAGAENN